MPATRNLTAFAFNNTNISISLSTVYNTVVKAPYRNYLYCKESPLHCVIFTAKGQGKITLMDKTTMILAENSVFLGAQTAIEKIECKNGTWEFYSYWFNIYGLKLPNATTFKVPNDNEDEFSKDIIDLILRKDFYSIEKANAKFYLKFIDWLSLNSQINNIAGNYTLIKESCDYIHANISQPLHISILAQKSGFCEKHYRELFKKYTGLSPKAYIENIRIEKACMLIRTSDLTLEEIAFMVGFSNSQHFSTVFKKVYKIPPKTFSKNIKKNYKGQTIDPNTPPQKI